MLIASGNAGCRQTSGDSNGNAVNNLSNFETSSTPPFSTKEPERYRATRITTTTTTSSSDQAADENSSASSRSEIFIARDGAMRREDYEASPGIKVSRLELPDRVYLIYHAKKLYAEVKSDKSMSGSSSSSVGNSDRMRSEGFDLPDFAPDKLINESRAESHYEKLGTEEINGRAATKYLVTTRVTISGGAQPSMTTGTFLWIDETLGMLIRSESTQTGDTVAKRVASKYIVELQDIRQDVDAGLFALPAGYKQVDYKELSAQMIAGTRGSLFK